MAINDKDFYASHGLDFDYKNMLDEYIKGVISQAKIEVLTEIQLEIEEVSEVNDYDFRIYKEGIDDCMKIIQAKINVLKGVEDRNAE